MMTSRAEYRLLLRQDNADLRLTEIGHKVGLISDDRYEHLLEKKRMIEEEVKRVKEVYVGAGAFASEFLTKHDSTPLKTAASIADLIRRPELNYDVLSEIDENRPILPKEVTEQVEIFIKYEGYIERQQKQVEDFKKIEKRILPIDIDYTTVSGLRLEAQQKLNKYKPTSIGQASRLSGVTPADISVLLVASEQVYKMRKEKENDL